MLKQGLRPASTGAVTAGRERFGTGC